MSTINFSPILPEWPAPSSVKAYVTTRNGGISTKPFDSLNIATHVGDTFENVQKNRQLMKNNLQLPNEPYWLNQIHSNRIIQLASSYPNSVSADAAFSREFNKICIIQSADCLPILLCDKKGSVVGAIHAGWRGLAAGIVELMVNSLKVDSQNILVWLGPAISFNAFEVGVEVYHTFIQHSANAKEAFCAIHSNKWLCDIYALARLRLNACGVHEIYGGKRCTFAEENNFYSYRRNKITGRIASMIYLTESFI